LDPVQQGMTKTMQLLIVMIPCIKYSLDQPISQDGLVLFTYFLKYSVFHASYTLIL